MTVLANARPRLTTQTACPEPVAGLPAGWVALPLDEVVAPSSDRVNPRNMSHLSYVGMEHVEAHTNRLIATVPASSVSSSSAHFYAGDVLYGRMRPYLNKVARLPFEGLASAEFMVFAETALLDNRFLLFRLSATDFVEFACSQNSGDRPRVKFEQIGPFPLLIPPRAEQTRIVEKLEELLSDLDAGVAELKAAQKKLTQYRQSLLKAAVEGALTADWRARRAAATPSPRGMGRGSVLSEPSSLGHHPLPDPPPRGEGTCESGAQLLERILKERHARWQAKQLTKFKEQGKAPPKDWQDKYPEPVKPDITDLPPLPEGWVWASVEQIASDEQHSLSIGPFGSNLKVSDYRNAGVPLVFVRNIRSGRYGGSNTKFVASDKADELNAHSTQAGDVLITKMGEPPGDADVYPVDQPPAIITADCIKVRCWPGLIKAQFLATVINSNIGKNQVTPMTQGVAQKKVSLGRFSTLVVPLPSHTEQLAIVETLTALTNHAERQADAIALSVTQSTAQRKNILKAAFAGQLVPQEPDDEPASVLLARIRAERAGLASKPRVGRRKAALADVI